MKYKFSGVPDLHRVIAENETALGVILSSDRGSMAVDNSAVFTLANSGVVGLIHATFDEMSVVVNGGCYITHSACAVVQAAQTPRVSYVINHSNQWSGLQYQDRGDKSPVLGRGIYLPEGWRLVTGPAAEIRKSFAAVQVRRAIPAKTTVEVISHS